MSSSSTTASAVTFSVTAKASPLRVNPGQTVAFAAQVTADADAADYAVGLQVFLGNSFLDNASRVFPGVSFRADVPVTKRSNWSIPEYMLPGNYTLLAGVFDSHWNWQTGAAIPFVVGHVERPGLSRGLSAVPPYSCITNRYVDAVNGSDANPGTEAAPWKTIQNADNGPNTPVSGECVNLLPGTYWIRSTIILRHGGNANTPAGYVVYRATVPQKAHIIAAAGLGGNGDMLMLWAPYIMVDGLDVDGNSSLAAGSGIDGCAGGGSNTDIAHHFAAMNNIVHDVGGAGLASCTADYVTWEHNVVYNTSSTSSYQVSGIDLWQPEALAPGSYTPTLADDTPFGIKIAYNIAHNNSEGPTIPAPHTDGNGIIIDTTLGSSTCPTCGTPYPGNILVLGNLAYGNGGGGIHVFLSKNVTVAGNTVYNNYLDTLNPGTARGELSSGGSQDITWVNNIAIAVPGAGVLRGNRPIVSFPTFGKFLVSGSWTKNIAFGAAVISTRRSYVDPATNLVGVDPRLADPARGDFVPLPGSPAIGAGQPESYIPSLAPDVGAY
jgi:parallel beta-helix repeat protein